MEVKMNGSEDVALIIIMPIMIAFWAWVVWAILEWRKMRHMVIVLLSMLFCALVATFEKQKGI